MAHPLEQATPSKRTRIKQLLYIVTPLFSLVLCVVLINFPFELIGDSTASSATPGKQPQTEAETETLILMATPATAVSPTSTAILPTPTAPLPPDAAIVLLGPPADSLFRLDDAVSFYSAWPVTLPDDQRLVVYIRSDGQDMPLGELEEPNMGNAYRWQENIADFVETAVSIQWLVKLQTTSDPPLILAESEARTLRLSP